MINIGSHFGVIAFNGSALYAGAKSSVRHLSRAVARMRGVGCDVKVVAPCITETDHQHVALGCW